MRETCINPHELAEGDLMAYVDGGAPSAVAAHVQRCPYCQEEVRRLRRLAERLPAVLFRADCPDPLTLAQYQMNLLPTDEHVHIDQHVADCADCRAELQQLSTVDADPAAVLLDRIREVRGAIRRVVEAVLVSPLPRRAAIAGVRGWPGPHRYQAGDLDVILEWEPGPGPARKGNLLGRVTQRGHPVEGIAGSWVWLAAAGEIQNTTVLDETGCFTLRLVPWGVYDLGFGWEDNAILVRDVQVG